MNACVRAVVRTALFNQVKVSGIIRGYNGLLDGEIKELSSHSVSNIIQRGGTILKSARSEKFRTPEGRKEAADILRKHGIDGLVVIGGDGTFTGAHFLFEEHGIAVIGAPGTIDNDLYGTDYTIGYDTAVNTALSAVDRIRDTAEAHDRVFFIEVMGRDAGYIALNVAIGGGAEAVLIPETETDLNHIADTLKEGWEREKTSSIIIVAEGDEQGGAYEVVEKLKKDLPQLKYRIAVLGHIQRGGSPTAMDRMLASRLGHAAVSGLLNGKKDCMAGILNNKVEYTPLAEAISIDKPINPQLIEMTEILAH